MTAAFDFNSRFEKVWGITLMLMKRGLSKWAPACKELKKMIKFTHEFLEDTGAIHPPFLNYDT